MPPPYLSRLAGVSHRLVDMKLGVVQYVSELPPMPGSPPFFHYFANAADTRALGGLSNFNNAGGASADRDTAVAKAVGEAVERYCSAIYDLADLPLSSYDDAGFPCVVPEEWALYSEEQYERPGFMWAPFTTDAPVRWTRAIDLLGGGDVHVPACMVYMPYYFHLADGDTPIVQPISTGMACHSSPAEAAIAGLCEVIERDSLMITWQAMLAPPQITVDSLSDANYGLVAAFERTGSRVTLLDITLDTGVPTVLSVLKSAAGELPALVFAASTSLDAETAVRKSLEELAHTRRYCHAIKSWMPRLQPAPPDHGNVTDQISHLNFWTDQANAHLADFIFASDIRVDFESMASLGRSDGREDHRRDLATLCTAVASTGHRVLVVDLTTPDVAELGLTVVRALVPGFQPLFMSYENRSLGSHRLWTLPQQLGYPGITPGRGDNPSPHMYP